MRYFLRLKNEPKAQVPQQEVLLFGYELYDKIWFECRLGLAMHLWCLDIGKQSGLG